MLTRLAHTLAAVRFGLWRRVTTARLERLGVTVRWEVAGPPRFWTLPRLEPVVQGGGPGSLAIRLGRDVKLGRELVLDDDVPVLRRPLRLGRIVLGRNVTVSANCVLLRGTTVGPNAVVAAGAVLNGGEYPGGWLVGGLPAKPLRALEGVDGRPERQEEAPR